MEKRRNVKGMSTEDMKKVGEQVANDNLQSYQEMCALFGGQEVMDTSDARREILIKHLVDSGVWSEEQYLAFELDFHWTVQEQLEHAWAQIREQRARQSLVKPVSRPIFGPNGQQIGQVKLDGN